MVARSHALEELSRVVFFFFSTYSKLYNAELLVRAPTKQARTHDKKSDLLVVKRCQGNKLLVSLTQDIGRCCRLFSVLSLDSRSSLGEGLELLDSVCA